MKKWKATNEWLNNWQEYRRMETFVSAGSSKWEQPSTHEALRTPEVAWSSFAPKGWLGHANAFGGWSGAVAGASTSAPTLCPLETLPSDRISSLPGAGGKVGACCPPLLDRDLHCCPLPPATPHIPSGWWGDVWMARVPLLPTAARGWRAVQGGATTRTSPHSLFLSPRGEEGCRSPRLQMESASPHSLCLLQVCTAALTQPLPQTAFVKVNLASFSVKYCC